MQMQMQIGDVKTTVNSMVFVFTLIGVGPDSFAVFAFAPIKASEYVDMFFHFILH